MEIEKKWKVGKEIDFNTKFFCIDTNTFLDSAAGQFWLKQDQAFWTKMLYVHEILSCTYVRNFPYIYLRNIDGKIGVQISASFHLRERSASLKALTWLLASYR